VVDDDAVVRTLVRVLLERSGFKVSEAENGAAALEQLGAGGQYHLVVLDLNMPELNGAEVLGRLRSNAATADLPVVMLTGSADAELQATLPDQSAADCIRKPLDPSDFVARIKAVVPRPGG
jgi:DNA-binding response OmpR family regulator